MQTATATTEKNTQVLNADGFLFPSHRGGGAQLRRGVRQQPSQPLPIRRPVLQPYKLRHHRRRPVAAAPDVRWEERRDEPRVACSPQCLPADLAGLDGAL